MAVFGERTIAIESFYSCFTILMNNRLIHNSADSSLYTIVLL